MYHRGTYAENRGPHAEWGEEEGRSLAGSNQDLRFIIYNAQERARARAKENVIFYLYLSLFSSLSLSLSRTRSLSRFFLSAPYTSGFLRFLYLSLSFTYMFFSSLPCPLVLRSYSTSLSFSRSFTRTHADALSVPRLCPPVSRCTTARVINAAIYRRDV